jgi:predicted small secreted protein
MKRLLALLLAAATLLAACESIGVGIGIGVPIGGGNVGVSVGGSVPLPRSKPTEPAASAASAP